VILRSHGRHALQFELDGRVTTIPVEIGADGGFVYLLAVPRWDDGEPVDPQTTALLRPVITEIERFWGMEPGFAGE
jgi:hypothetical protein